MRDTLKNYLIKNFNSESFFITNDLGYNVIDNLQKRYKKNFLNIGICEQSAISFSCGISDFYKNTYVYSIGNFLVARALEQIRNDICYHNKNITLISVGAGFSYSKYGYSHYCIEDAGLVSSLPNINVFTPFNGKSLLKCLSYCDKSKKPNYIRIGNTINDLDDVNINFSKNIFAPIKISKNNFTNKCVISIGRITGYLYNLNRNKEFDHYALLSNNNFNLKLLEKLFNNYKHVCIVDEQVDQLSIINRISLLKKKTFRITIKNKNSYEKIGTNEYLINEYMNLDKEIKNFIKHN